MGSDWRPENVQPGDVLIATDAGGDEHEVRALTSLWFSEFPDTTSGRVRWKRGAVVTIAFTTKDTEGRAWPAEALRPPEATR